jgi:hypothetical protein
MPGQGLTFVYAILNSPPENSLVNAWARPRSFGGVGLSALRACQAFIRARLRGAGRLVIPVLGPLVVGPGAEPWSLLRPSWRCRLFGLCR